MRARSPRSRPPPPRRDDRHGAGSRGPDHVRREPRGPGRSPRRHRGEAGRGRAPRERGTAAARQGLCRDRELGMASVRTRRRPAPANTSGSSTPDRTWSASDDWRSTVLSRRPRAGGGRTGRGPRPPRTVRAGVPLRHRAGDDRVDAGPRRRGLRRGGTARPGPRREHGHHRSEAGRGGPAGAGADPAGDLPGRPRRHRHGLAPDDHPGQRHALPDDRLSPATSWSGRTRACSTSTTRRTQYVGREKYAQICADGIGAVETQWRTKDGAVRDILLSSSPVDLARPHEDVVFNALDITRLRESERALASYMDDLQRSNEELQRFAYVASHDLQEPLRSIISFTQLLERRYRGKLDTDADEFIGFIIEGGNRMQRLIEDLLQLSRVETKAKPLVPTDAGEVVADALRLMETPIREAGATVEVGDLPDGDGRRGPARAGLHEPGRQRPEVPPAGRAARDPHLGRTGGRVLAVRRAGQRDRDRGRVLRPDLRDLPAPPHPGRVRGDGDRPGRGQEDRRAARRPDRGRVDAGRGLDLLTSPSRPPEPPNGGDGRARPVHACSATSSTGGSAGAGGR